MKSEEQIRKELARIDADERIHYPPATIQINAPLALIQLGLETRRDALKWVLEP
jgi:hypothetical protein